MGRAIISSVEMSAKAVEAVRELAQRTGMKQKSLVGRVLEWFTSLPRVEQFAILHRLGDEPELGELLIRRKLSEILDEQTAYNVSLRLALGLAGETTSRHEVPAKRRGRPRSKAR